MRTLLRPVDAASLAFFRIAFGLLMCADALRKLFNGTVTRDYIEPRLHFKFPYFEWVQLWPGNGMYIHFVVMAACALMVALGVLTRTFAFLFFLLFSYVFLLDSMFYLNHYYLIMLVALLLSVIPTDRMWSIAAWRKPMEPVVPAWALWLVRVQLAIPYVFGGIAKLEPDWLSGVPMYIWLQQGPPFGVELSLMGNVPVLLAWAGMLFDLLIVPAVFWRRTRVVAFIAAFAFHAFNHFLFRIGVFPFLMLGATTMFFDPSWPRRFLPKAPVPSDKPAPEIRALHKLTLAAVALYLLVQVLVPFREHLYPGNSDWTEEGHYFSWKMKLRSKVSKSMLVIRDPDTGKLGPVEPDAFFQVGEARRMASRPDYVLQFAHYMRDEFARRGASGVEIYGRALVSLNGRTPADLIDQNVDLSKIELSILPSPWILPLTEPLPSLESLQAAHTAQAAAH